MRSWFLSLLEVVVVSKGLIVFITGSKVRTAATTLSGNLYREGKQQIYTLN